MITSKEKNDCSVVALANATGKSYEDCHLLLKSMGRGDGCTVWSNIVAAACLREGGKINLFAIDYREQYLTPKRTFSRYAPYLKSGNFVVITQHHVFCVKDGAILDENKVADDEEVVSVYYFK